VVFYSAPREAAGSGSYSKFGRGESAVPQWAKFDVQLDSMQHMIRMNFESARLTHPGCRLVVLSDPHTPLESAQLDPALPGPPVEVRARPDHEAYSHRQLHAQPQ
jgi:hypothetical protein